MSETTLPSDVSRLLADNDISWACGIVDYADSIARFKTKSYDRAKMMAWAKSHDIPELESEIEYWMTQYYKYLDTILDMVANTIKYKRLTTKQVNYLKILGKKTHELNLDEYAKVLRKKLDAKAKEIANANPVPNGMQTVIGTLTSVKKNVSGPYGIQSIMTVHSDDGYRIYGTLPKALSNAKAGSRVKFTGTLKQSSQDKYFGFVSRPSKAEIIYPDSE